MIIYGYKYKDQVEKISQSNRFDSHSDKLTDVNSAKLAPLFSSWFKKLEKPNNPIIKFEQLGELLFSTMFIMLDFFNSNHSNVTDIEHRFSVWFSKGEFKNPLFLSKFWSYNYNFDIITQFLFKYYLNILYLYLYLYYYLMYFT